MNKKLMLLVLSVVLMGLFASSVSAQSIFDDVKNFFEESPGLRFLTVDLANEFAQDPPSALAMSVGKVLFMILLFAILFGASSLMQFDKNIRIAVSALIAIIVGIFTPSEWFTAIVKLYTGGIIFALIAVPVVLLFWLNFKYFKEANRFTYLIKTGLAFGMLFCINVAANISLVGVPAAKTIEFILEALRVAAFVMIFYYFVWGVLLKTAGKKTKEAGSWFAKKGSWLSSKLPTSLARPLKRMERWAYRVNKLEESEIEGIEAVKTGLDGLIKTMGEEIKTGTGSVASKKTKAQTFNTTLSSNKNSFKRYTENYANRLEKWTLDISVLAKRVKDSNLIAESEGMLAEERIFDKELDGANKKLGSARNHIKEVEDMPDDTDSPIAKANEHFRKANEWLEGASVEIGKMIKQLTKLNTLTKDILKKAAKKDIETPEEED